MMLSISVTAFAQDTSSDCDKEYYDRYGRWMENHLVTWWGVPPVLMRSSGKYADLICEKLSEINYEDTHFFITFFTTVQRNYPIGSVDLNRNHSSDVLV